MPDIKMIISAQNNASDDINKVKEQLTGLGTAAKTAGDGASGSMSKWDSLMGTFTGINNAIGLAGQAFQTLSGVYQSVVSDTVDYAKEVRDLSRSIGASAEDTSKLIQAADDVGISFGTLEKGMTIAIKNGIDPTIEGMGALADEYLSIQDPIERTRFLLDTFGKAGADLAPLMELGAEGITKLGDAAESTGLVLSGKAVADARAYEVAVDNLTDAWQGFITKVGTEVIPVVTDLLNQFSDSSSISDMRREVGDLASALKDAGEITGKEYNAIMKEAYAKNKTTAESTEFLTSTLEVLKTQYSETGGAVDTTAESLINQSIAAAQAATSVEKAAAANGLLSEEALAAAAAQAQMNAELANITSVGGNYKGIIDYAYEYSDITEEITELEAKKTQLISDGAVKNKKEIDELTGKIEGLYGSLDEMSKMVVLDMFEATIAVGGVTEAELAAYLDMAVAMGMMSEEGKNAAIKAYGEAYDVINGYKIDDKTGNIIIDGAAAMATLDFMQQYSLLDKEQRIFVRTYYDSGSYDYSLNDRAVGGSVNAGQPYNWQEHGYRGEVFVPSADGFVLSRADAERALAKALYGGQAAVDPEAIGRAVAQAMSGITSSRKGGNVYNLTMPTSSNPADVRSAFELMEAWA